MTYSEKFQDPRWQKRRLEIMGRDKFRCICCESETETLAVHHSYYIKGRDPWEYPSWSLRTLCKSCHSAEHFEIRNEEGEVYFEEWEHQLDWISEGFGDGKALGEFWYTSAQIVQALHAGVPRKELFDALEHTALCIKEKKMEELQ